VDIIFRSFHKKNPMAKEKTAKSIVFQILLALLFLPIAGYSCTTILIGSKLTADGSVIHAHNEDMGTSAVGRLWTVPSHSYKNGVPLEVPYVTIPQVAQTWQYWASGNAESADGLGISEVSGSYNSILVGMNQWGLTMSCNWMNSREESLEKKGIRRYAIRQLILERAKSAREAVKLIADFIDQYGQADWSGLTYCLADSKEAWIVETTTRHWVARRVRDDEIWVVANRFTIGTDYDLSSEGLIEFAVGKGWYDAAEGKFSFRDAFGLPEKMNQPYDSEREERVMELLENKKGAITPGDLFVVLRDRYEGTPKYALPVEDEIWRDYCDEHHTSRPISTNLAQSSSVAHLRSDLPVEFGAVMWYAMATPNFSGYFPIYASATKIPNAFSKLKASPSDDSAWWTFRMLQQTGDLHYNQAYLLGNNFWTANQASLDRGKKELEQKVLGLVKHGESGKAIELLNIFTFSQSQNILYQAHRLLEMLTALSKKSQEGLDSN